MWWPNRHKHLRVPTSAWKFGSVRFFAFFWQDQDWDQSLKIRNLKKPGPNWWRLVPVSFIWFFPVLKQVWTSLWFRPVSDWSYSTNVLTHTTYLLTINLLTVHIKFFTILYNINNYSSLHLSCRNVVDGQTLRLTFRVREGWWWVGGWPSHWNVRQRVVVGE